MPGAESCAGARELAQAVERRLGRPAFASPVAGEIAIEGRIERREDRDGWHATIAVFDEKGHPVGQRELERSAADCRALDPELELVVSLLVDPSAALGPAPAPPPPQILPAPTRQVRPAAPVTCPAPSPSPARPWQAGAEAGAILGMGILPGTVGGGVSARARIAPPRGPSFELGGAFWFDGHADAAKERAAFSLTYGWLSVCPVDAKAAGFSVGACAGVQVGSLRVGGEGFPSAFRQEQLILNVAVDARVRRRLVGPLFAGLGAGLAVPTVRDWFFFTDLQGTKRDVFQAAPVVGLFDLALGLAFP